MIEFFNLNGFDFLSNATINLQFLLFANFFNASVGLFIVVVAIYQERTNLGGYFEYVGVVAPIILFFVLLVAVIFTKFFVDGIDSQRSITVECLLQNGAMGFIVSAQIFTDIAYVTPIALYALLQYFVLAFYVANIKIVK